MAQQNQPQHGPAAGQPVAAPVLPTDDRVRNDGGKTTEDKPVSQRQMEQIAEKARDHTKDEPGS